MANRQVPDQAPPGLANPEDLITRKISPVDESGAESPIDFDVQGNEVEQPEHPSQDPTSERTADNLNAAESKAAENADELSGKNESADSQSIEKSENTSGENFKYQNLQTGRGKAKGAVKGKSTKKKITTLLILSALGFGGIGAGMFGPQMLFFKFQDVLTNKFNYQLPGLTRYTNVMWAQKIFGGSGTCSGAKCKFQGMSQRSYDKMIGKFEGANSKVTSVTKSTLSNGKIRVENITLRVNGKDISVNAGNYNTVIRNPAVRAEVHKFFHPKFEGFIGKAWDTIKAKFGIDKSTTVKEDLTGEEEFSAKTADVAQKQQEVDQARQDLVKVNEELSHFIAGGADEAEIVSFRTEYIDPVQTRLNAAEASLRVAQADLTDFNVRMYGEGFAQLKKPSIRDKLRAFKTKITDSLALKIGNSKIGRGLQNMLDRIKSDAGKITETGGKSWVGTISAAKGIAQVSCLSYMMAKGLVYVSRVAKVASVVSEFQKNMTTIAKIKAGEGTADEAGVLGERLTNSVKGSNQGKTATDSFGYKYAAYNDLPSASDSTSQEFKTWQTGGNFLGVGLVDGWDANDTGLFNLAGSGLVWLSGVIVKMVDITINYIFNNDLAKLLLPGVIRTNLNATMFCIIVNNILGNILADIGTIIADVGLDIASLGANLVIGIATTGVVVVALGTITTLITKWASSSLTKLFSNQVARIVDSSEFGEMMTSGAGANLGELAFAGGNQLLTKSQAIAFMDDMRETNLAYAEEDRVDRSPLDTSSPNTFLGAIAYEILPRFASFGTSLWSIGSVFSGIVHDGLFAPLKSASAAADETAQFSYCDTSWDVLWSSFSYSHVDVALDPYCNPIFGSPVGEEKGLDEVIEYLSGMGQIDSSGEIIPGSTFDKFKKQCTERTDPLGWDLGAHYSFANLLGGGTGYKDADAAKAAAATQETNLSGWANTTGKNAIDAIVGDWQTRSNPGTNCIAGVKFDNIPNSYFYAYIQYDRINYNMEN